MNPGRMSQLTESRGVPALAPSRGVPADAGPARTSGSATPGDSSAQAWAPTLPGILAIHVDSAGGAPRDAWGEASGRGVYPFSRMGRLEHFCSTPATYPVRVRFYVDSTAAPRPQPFRPPSLSLAASFTPAGGPPRQVASAADASPRYDGPGWPLVPAFGDTFTANSSSGGVLAVTARLADPDAGVTITYTDAIPCELVPCA